MHRPAGGAVLRHRLSSARSAMNWIDGVDGQDDVMAVARAVGAVAADEIQRRAAHRAAA